MNPINIWHGDHLRFERLLDFLEHEMTAFHAGEEPNYQLMRDTLYYLHHFADRFHHPHEDVAFKLMVRHDPGFETMVNRLMQEHRAIAHSGEALLEILEEILEDTIMERAKVEAAAALYLVYFRHHLNTEETEILPRAAQMLTPEDWSAVAAAGPEVPDPLFGDDVALRYRNLREWITREEAAARG